jgi:hypothetical protein
MRTYPVINLGQFADSAIWSKPISEDMRPQEIPAECKFLGYLYESTTPGSASAEANLEAKTNLTLAQQAGYTDIKYTDAPVSGQLRPLAGKMVWACPGKVVRPPTGPASKYDQPQPSQTSTAPSQPLPPAPASAKPDLVPVAVGAGVVAILAALIGGAFGK